ncbi:hypothetical protein [uncultured Sphingomonas sp.]|uniref:hypothetical protein n=1 Tax=uncultured Sphingomonas sp. TaxID=158754 RepID=UPI0035CB5105
MSVIRTRPILLAGVAAVAPLAMSAGTAHAQSTPAGTTITNTAQASYSVNGTPQTATSNTATFLVDRKVNLTVINNAAANTSVNLGQSAAVLSFKVTNNTNAPQDFLLTPHQSLLAGILSGTDNFDASNVHVYVDANGNGTYEAGTDTATFIDELAADANATVFIVGDVPTTPTANLAQVGLEVTVAAGGATGVQGAALIPTLLSNANSDTDIDIVFADADNDGLGFDLARNGKVWAYGAYEITDRNVALSVIKSATVVSDGVNTLDPKAIPGAVVRYCLTVRNATPLTAASDVVLTDVIPTGTTYVAGSINVGLAGSGLACVLAGTNIADDGSSTGPYTGSFNAGSKTVIARIPTIPGSTSAAASFNVTIN